MGVTGMPTPNLDRAYFLDIPWCATLLQDPSYTLIPTGSRQPKPSSTEDTAFAETLNTKATIGAYQEFYKKATTGKAEISELCTLLSLGYGINGHAGICHGGILAAILDEVMGNILTRSTQIGNEEIARDHFTAYLNTTYVKPVKTPQVVLAKSWIKEIKGRKYYTEGAILDENGVVLSKGEALFIGVNKSKARL